MESNRFVFTLQRYARLYFWVKYRPPPNCLLCRAIRRLIKHCEKLFIPEQHVLVNLESDSKFTFSVYDDYWGRLLYRDANLYEPEIEAFLQAFKKSDYVLLDLGANFGYWSIKATSGAFGRHRAIAVEASKQNFHYLLKNATLNDGRFTCLHRAVWHKTGATLSVVGDTHAGTQAVELGVENKEYVETITIDDITKMYNLVDRLLVVKLDVEGAEIDALVGGRGTITSSSVWLYEDHGKDPLHKVTRKALSFGSVYYLKNNKIVKITDVNYLNTIKKCPSHGYNFIFTASDEWKTKIEACFL